MKIVLANGQEAELSEVKMDDEIGTVVERDGLLAPVEKIKQIEFSLDEKRFRLEVCRLRGKWLANRIKHIFDGVSICPHCQKKAFGAFECETLGKEKSGLLRQIANHPEIRLKAAIGMKPIENE